MSIYRGQAVGRCTEDIKELSKKIVKAENAIGSKVNIDTVRATITSAIGANPDKAKEYMALSQDSLISLAKRPDYSYGMPLFVIMDSLKKLGY